MKRTMLILMCAVFLGATLFSQTTQRLRYKPKLNDKTRSIRLAPVLISVVERNITIEFEEAFGVVTVLLESEDGTIVYNDFVDTTEMTTLTIDVENWAAGIYYVEVETENAFIYGDFEL